MKVYREPRPTVVLTFLMPGPFNTVPHAAATVPLLLHNCNSANVINCNISI